MKIYLPILLLLLALVCSTTEETTKKATSATPKYVTQLTDATFDKFISDNKFAFVCFYDKMAQDTKTMLKEFDVAANKYHDKISFGRLDITKNPKVTQKLQLDRFPSFTYFDDGDQIQYDWHPTGEYFTFWLDRVLSPAYVVIESKEQLDMQLAEEEVAKIFFYGKPSGKQFEIYARVGHLDRDNRYYLIESPDLVKDMWTPTVKLHASFHHPNSWSTFQGQWTKEALSQWIDDRALPTIVTLNQRTSKYIFDTKQKSLFLVDAGEDLENLLGVMETFCEENPRFTCGKVSRNDELFYSFAAFIGTPQEIVKSQLLILDSSRMRMYRYKQSVPQITSQLLAAWIADWKADKLRPDNLDDEQEQEQGQNAPKQQSQCEADKENTNQYGKTMQL